MIERKTKPKAEKSKKIILGNTAAYLAKCWEQANLPRSESDQQNFEKAAQLITDFMDWHRVEDNEIKFVGEKFFPTFLRVGKLQPSKEVSSQLLVKMGPDILDSLL